MADEPEVGGVKKLIGSKLWILVAVLALLVAGDLTSRALSYFRDSTSAQRAASGNSVAKSRKAEVKSTLPLEPFVVNLADKEEVRYVKATFQLGLEEKSSEAVKDPVSIAAMRDSIISILSAKTSAQIMTTEGKEKLRQEIRARLTAIAPAMKIQEIFIVEFVVQL